MALQVPPLEAERGELSIRRMRQLAPARLRLAGRMGEPQLAALAQRLLEDGITNDKE
jgi:hypothetical protein